jgi:uncharacterized protein YaaN involved in tellurite resistance
MIEVKPGTQEWMPMPNASALPKTAPAPGNAQPIDPESSATVPSMYDSLSDADLASVQSYSQRIDLTDPDNILLYGANVQKKISVFSDNVLASVKNSDSGDVTGSLQSLAGELQAFQVTAQKPTGIRAVFSKPKRQNTMVQARFDKVAMQIDKIAGNLEIHQIRLLKDAALLTRLYDLNLACFKELTMYILAGEARLKEALGIGTPAVDLTDKAGYEAFLKGKADDLAANCQRFNKKLYDLKLTRQISMQMSFQIRLLQGNDSQLAERIQSTLANTLPLWKNQMILALGMQHAREAMNTQRTITSMTGGLLQKNMDNLKQATKLTAKEARRGIVDIEALAKTNRSLLETVNDVIRIQAESRAKRAEAEKTLLTLESDLKQKLA